MTALRQQLYDSFKNRARLYWLIYDELRRELGPAKAEELLSRAIYRRGVERGREAFAQFGPRDLAGLRDAFLGGIPDDGAMFQPQVTRDDAEGLDIKFQGCPLRDAWCEAGLSDDDMATMCRIAGRVDNGTFEAAGFGFWADTWRAGESGCCYLHIRPGAAAAGI